MDYYINPIWFYLMDISDCLNYVSAICAILFIGVAALWCCIEMDMDDDEDEEKRTVRSKRKKFLLGGIIFFILAILCPSEKTCLRMMVASQCTKENVTNVKEEVYDIVDYIDEKLNKE